MLYCSSIYFVYLSSLHRDIYLFYICIFIFSYHCAVGARTHTWATPLPIFFFFSSGWTEIGQSNTCILTAYDSLSTRHDAPTAESAVKSRTKGSESSYLRLAGCRHFWLVIRRMIPLKLCISRPENTRGYPPLLDRAQFQINIACSALLST